MARMWHGWGYMAPVARRLLDVRRLGVSLVVAAALALIVYGFASALSINIAKQQKSHR